MISTLTHLLPNPDSLSLRERVAQMLVVRASGHLFDHQIQYPSWEPPADVLRYWLQDLGVGGVIFWVGALGSWHGVASKFKVGPLSPCF